MNLKKMLANDHEMFERLIPEKDEGRAIYKYVIGENLTTDESGYHEHLLKKAGSRGNLKYIRFLVENGKVDIGGCFDSLLGAIESGHLNIVEYLIDQGVPFQFQEVAFEAVKGGHLGVMKYLVDRGLNINSEKRELKWFTIMRSYRTCREEKEVCQTPLFFAMNKDDFEMVKFLVESGANVNVAGTYFSFCNYRNREIIKYLDEQGGRDTDSYRVLKNLRDVVISKGKLTEILKQMKELFYDGCSSLYDKFAFISKLAEINEATYWYSKKYFIPIKFLEDFCKKIPFVTELFNFKDARIFIGKHQFEDCNGKCVSDILLENRYALIKCPDYIPVIMSQNEELYRSKDNLKLLLWCPGIYAKVKEYSPLMQFLLTTKKIAKESNKKQFVRTLVGAAYLLSADKMCGTDVPPEINALILSFFDGSFGKKLFLKKK